MNFESTLTTPVCERLEIKYPILQAGMGFVAPAELAEAISALSELPSFGFRRRSRAC